MSQLPRVGSAPRLLALLLLLAAPAALGCGVKMPVVSLYDGPDTPPPGAQTGVVPFADERPEVQREGDKPWLIPLVLFNWRRGEYVTGDQHFEQEPVGAVAEAVTDTLGVGRFGPAELLDGAPSGDRWEASDRCRSRGLRYGVVGRVEQLYGSVDQNAYLFVFPIPYLWLFGFRNDKTDPLGVIDLQLDVFDCQTGKVVYRRHLLEQRRYPKQTPSDAVRLALRDLLEQLENETRELPAPAAVPQP
jgi:hypothetical protein